MSDMMVSSGVPEVTMGQTAPAPAGNSPSFSGKWEDFSTDMAAIQQEMQPAQPASAPAAATATPEVSPTQQAPQVPAPVAPQAEAATPAQPAPAKPAVEIPEKFRAANGALDEEKLLKSYLEAEKALKRGQNRQAQAQVQPTPVAPAPAPVNTGLSPFELQVAQDLFNGGGYTEQQAISQARVLVKLQEAKHQADKAATFARVETLEQRLEEQQNREELTALRKSNPEVFTPQTFQELTKIREDNPWINAAPEGERWRTALMVLLGQRAAFNQQSVPGQVPMPTPQGVQQTAKPLPVTPAPVAPSPITLNTQAEIEAYVKTLTPAQEAEFWKRSGLKWDSPAPFKSVF